jgi:hypothetical protein
VDPCATPSTAAGPNVGPNNLFPNDIDEGPNVLDDRLQNAPQERGATTAGEAGEGLPFTGADLTLFALLGVVTITVGVLLLKGRRRAGHPV